MVGELKKRKRN